MPYIYSTMTNTNFFAVYAPKNDVNATSRIVKRIEIKGGHGMKNPQGIDTPKGVATKVSDEDLAALESMVGFRDQVKAGFLVVDKKLGDTAKKADSMAARDGSSPLTPADFEKGEHSTNQSPIYKPKVDKRNADGYHSL